MGMQINKNGDAEKKRDAIINKHEINPPLF